MKKKIISIIGARPQFVKVAAFNRALKEKNLPIEAKMIHTGQHHDSKMSDLFFEEMEIDKPDYNLAVHGGSHGQMTGKMLEEVEKVLLKEKPDLVVVYGDTNSTLAGAVAASKLHIPIAHIEAGLRSFDRKMPEELNRVLTDHCSQLLFTPTESAKQNLKQEGLSDEAIVPVGDIMLDAFRFYSKKKRESICEKLNLKVKDYVLVTVHRQERTDNKEQLSEVLRSLEEISQERPVVWPLHPRTKKKMEEFALQTDKILFLEPQGYLDMIQLEKNASLIITDSGGVQKEAYFAKTPCIVLRERTEWIELIEKGGHLLSKANPRELLANYHKLLEKKEESCCEDLYGQGDSADKIVDAVIDFIQLN